MRQQGGGFKLGGEGIFVLLRRGTGVATYFFLYLPMPIALLGGIFVASSPIPPRVIPVCVINCGCPLTLLIVSPYCTHVATPDTCKGATAASCSQGAQHAVFLGGGCLGIEVFSLSPASSAPFLFPNICPDVSFRLFSTTVTRSPNLAISYSHCFHTLPPKKTSSTPSLSPPPPWNFSIRDQRSSGETGENKEEQKPF